MATKKTRVSDEPQKISVGAIDNIRKERDVALKQLRLATEFGEWIHAVATGSEAGDWWDVRERTEAFLTAIKSAGGGE